MGVAFFHGLPRSSSACEPRLGNAADAQAGDAKEAPREELRLRFLREAAVHRGVLDARHRGDVDLVELIPAEDDAGDVPHGHADAPLDAPVGRVAHQVTPNELRVPHATLRITSRPSAAPPLLLTHTHDPLIPGLPGP